MKKTGIHIGNSKKLSKDGKSLVENEKRLDVSTRLQRRKSKKIRVKPVDAFRV